MAGPFKESLVGVENNFTLAFPFFPFCSIEKLLVLEGVIRSKVVQDGGRGRDQKEVVRSRLSEIFVMCDCSFHLIMPAQIPQPASARNRASVWLCSSLR